MDRCVELEAMDLGEGGKDIRSRGTDCRAEKRRLWARSKKLLGPKSQGSGSSRKSFVAAGDPAFDHSRAQASGGL